MFDKYDFFHKATLLICSSFQIERALYRIYTYLRHHMPAEHMHLGIIDPSAGRIRVIAKADATGGLRCNYNVPLSADSREQARHNLARDRKRIVTPSDYGPISRDWIRFHGRTPTAYLSVLLSLEDGGYGFLSVEADQHSTFQAWHGDRLALLRKPFEIALANALKHDDCSNPEAVSASSEQIMPPKRKQVNGVKIVGADSGLKDVMTLARSVAGVSTPVLLLGETGAGKEVIADAIHSMSPRANGPIVRVNCGAIPPSLVDSELFGFEKGAFTGASSRKPGRFERANHGTIFLDEIGELPPPAQVRLLRVLQNKELERVGGSRPIPLDVRVISATHRNLDQMVAAGEFREDLWFRLNVFPITVPPLRMRSADIPELVDYFIKRKALEMGIRINPHAAAGQLERLEAYPWPGNVRELENVVERALICYRGNGTRGTLKFNLPPLRKNGNLPSASDNTNPGHSEKSFLTLKEIVSNHIRKAIDLSNGRVEGHNGAAELLGEKPNTLRSKMKKLNIPYGRNYFREPDNSIRFIEREVNK